MTPREMRDDAERTRDHGLNARNPRASNRAVLTRRNMLRLGAGVGAATLALSRPAWATQPAAELAVRVGSTSVGAVASVMIAGLGSVSVDPSMGGDQFSIGRGDPAGITDRVLLKGRGPARDRFLDDARNALRVAMNMRDMLEKARPDLAPAIRRNEDAWAKPFAKKAFKWGRSLQSSSVHGKKVQDRDGRVYLLEWAGANVDPGGARPPAALATAPDAPAAPTIAAYEAYIQKLVAALA